MNGKLIKYGLVVLVLLGVIACGSITATSPTASSTEAPTSALMSTEAPTTVPVEQHLMKPGEAVLGKPVADVESSAKGAPFGDSYKINRLERPFLQDMTYVPDLDIRSFNSGEDADWRYVSIELNGSDPNNPIGIDYGVEIDVNADGFGDYLLWAHPPYKTEWDTSTVQVYQDTNHDTAGQSSGESDAGFNGNGYDRLVFDGSKPQNPDPDLVWVRMVEGPHALIQFAFKKSWLGPSIMLGVVADGGLKDVARYDYSDHFKKADAGSPVRGNQNYPLGALYAVDNTCWQAYGFAAPPLNAKSCPAPVAPTPTRKPHEGPTACVPLSEADQLQCGSNGYNPSICQCNP